MMASPSALLATPAMPPPIMAPLPPAPPAWRVDEVTPDRPPGRGCVSRFCSNPAAAACADELICTLPGCPLPVAPLAPAAPGMAPPPPGKPARVGPGGVGCGVEGCEKRPPPPESKPPPEFWLPPDPPDWLVVGIPIKPAIPLGGPLAPGTPPGITLPPPGGTLPDNGGTALFALGSVPPAEVWRGWPSGPTDGPLSLGRRRKPGLVAC